MFERSSLTEAQRAEAVFLFNAGHGAKAVHTKLGVGLRSIVILYDQWRLRGDDVLVTRPVRATFTFLFKAEIVRRALDGETYMDLAKEFDLSSTRLIQRWVQHYRDRGDDGLRGKPRGRPRVADECLNAPSELERLQQENERLRAENAFLGKVRALRAPGRRLKF